MTSDRQPINHIATLKRRNNYDIPIRLIDQGKIFQNENHVLLEWKILSSFFRRNQR